MIFGRRAYEGIRAKKIQHHDNKVTLAFRALDKDGSGTVETAEFKHLMTHVGQYLSLSCFFVVSVFVFVSVVVFVVAFVFKSSLFYLLIINPQATCSRRRR